MYKSKKVLAMLKGIKKDYPSGDGIVSALKGIDLEIYEHELLVVLGESGSGKTTLLNIIGGMDRPTSGSVTVGGRDIESLSEVELTKYRREYLGFIFQDFNLMPNMTAGENVRFIAEICGDADYTDEVIEKVGLSGRANSFPAQLSGGESQRVAIARALVKRPKLILADEPTAALDFSTAKEVLRVLERIVRDEKATIVMITHNTEIAKIADRVVRLRGGEIASVTENPHPTSVDELEW